MVITRQRLRLEVDVKIDTAASIIDVITSASPDMWRGNDTQFECCFFFGDELLSISNIASFTLEVKPKDKKTGAALMAKTLAAADADPTTTLADWEAGTKQHAQFNFTFDETNLALGSPDEDSFWLVISALTNDVPARKFTLGACVLVMREDGDGTPVAPSVLSNPIYPTLEQARALFGTNVIRTTNPAGVGVILTAEDGSQGYLYWKTAADGGGLGVRDLTTPI